MPRETSNHITDAMSMSCYEFEASCEIALMRIEIMMRNAILMHLKAGNHQRKL